MLHSFLFAPFSDPARQEQFEAVEKALHAEASLPTTLLLGNLAAFDAPPVDALLVQPGRLVLLMLVPERGQLRIPALEYGTWRLNDQPLPSFGAADNPFAFYCQQKDALTQWLGVQLGLGATTLPPLVGMVVFLAPISYGPEVESQLSRQATVHNFQLVGDARQLPRRVGQLKPSSGRPTASAIADWAAQLEAEHWADELPSTAEEPSYGFWEQQARRLWLWLGAADVPTDPPYSLASDPHQLEAFRRELQAELKQQQQAAQARETAREQEISQLRQQLAQTPAQQHLAQQERAELEAALRTARAESATRNQELDARIQQLGQLIEQLRTQTTQAPAPAAVKPADVAPLTKSPPPRPVRKPVTAPAVHLRLTRVALLVGVLLCVGLGGWGLVRLSKSYLAGRKPKREQTARVPQTTENYSTDAYAESDALPLADTVADAVAEQNSDGSLHVHDEPLIMHEESLTVHHPKLIMQVTSDSAAQAAEQEEALEPDSTTP